MVAKLPAPADIDAVARASARIFYRDLPDVMSSAGPLDTSVLSEKQNHLVSLYNTGPLELPMPRDRAVELFDQIVSWNPTLTDENDRFGASFQKSFNDFIRVQCSDVLTFAVTPAMRREDRTDARLRALLDFITRTQSWRAVAALPIFIETVPAMLPGVTLAIHRGLSAPEHLKISGAASGLFRWSQLVKTHFLTEIPRSLIEQLMSMIETRQEEGLHTLLETAVAVLKDGMLTNDDMLRLMRTLSDLREDNKYSDVPLDSRRAITISLIRQQCVRLAALLKQEIVDDGNLDAWLQEAGSDPLPEVRFATDPA
jgi:hypothetical protein